MDFTPLWGTARAETRALFMQPKLPNTGYINTDRHDSKTHWFDQRSISDFPALPHLNCVPGQHEWLKWY